MHLLFIRFFLNRFPVSFNVFGLHFLVTPCFLVAVQSGMERAPIKKIHIFQQVLRTWGLFKIPGGGLESVHGGVWGTSDDVLKGTLMQI